MRRTDSKDDACYIHCPSCGGKNIIELVEDDEIELVCGNCDWEGNYEELV
jgi:hypothetical protein